MYNKVNIMLRLTEIGSHATYKQILSQRIHNSCLKRFDKERKLAVKLLALDLSLLDEIMRPFLFRGRSSCMAAFLDAAFLLAFHLA